METIRKEIAQLRANPLRCGSNAASNPYVGRSGRGFRVDRDACWQGAVPALTDPSRVKKLTSFFGDEPPLLRIFLKKLGYEVIHYHPLPSIFFSKLIHWPISSGTLLLLADDVWILFCSQVLTMEWVLVVVEVVARCLCSWTNETADDSRRWMLIAVVFK